jgi:penicillin-binding protein 1A
MVPDLPADVPMEMGRMTQATTLAVVAALVAGACSYAPAGPELEGRRRAQSTTLLAADGSVLTTLDAVEDRQDVRLEDLPRHLVDAVVAIEDARYWSHNGVDLRALVRAAVRNAEEGEVVEGGSTITQQYVKVALLDPSKTLSRKVEEAVLAIRLEQRYSKEEILELYLNTVYFGNGAYGVQAAAHEYFGVDASALDLDQAATLAAVIRSPRAYDPRDHPRRAQRRRDLVLRRMVEVGSLRRQEADEARAAPLQLSLTGVGDRYPAPQFVEQVKRFILEDPRFGATRAERQELLFAGGLRVTTTLDPAAQAAAEQAVASVRPPAPGPDAALVAVEPSSGAVRALVGGRDFFSGAPGAKLDLATGGPGRPAGSAFKPFVLAAALAEGIPLDRTYPAPARLQLDLPGEVWDVENYEGGGGGEADLVEATAKSYNTVYAQLIEDVGPGDAVDMASRLGVATRLEPYYSAVLGTNLVHPLDMAAAYATFANRGVRVAPSFVSRVVGPRGRVLYEHRPAAERVLDERIAAGVTSVLQRVLADGTGVRARIGRPAAGKTGTGQEYRDAWFVGYTPELATAVWMGFPEEGTRSMVPPATSVRVSGGTWPATAWQRFMSAALASRPVTPFPELEDDEVVRAATLPRLDDVVGRPVQEAEDILRARGWEPRRRSVADGDYPPGTVLTTDPPAGTPLVGGSEVVLDVAIDVPEVGVPDVLGMDVEAAREALEQAGLDPDVTVEAEEPASAAAARAGLVWRQSPAAGRRAPEGSTVEVTANPG